MLARPIAVPLSLTAASLSRRLLPVSGCCALIGGGIPGAGARAAAGRWRGREREGLRAGRSCGAAVGGRWLKGV